jgi:hypothetical protein
MVEVAGAQHLPEPPASNSSKAVGAPAASSNLTPLGDGPAGPEARAPTA